MTATDIRAASKLKMPCLSVDTPATDEIEHRGIVVIVGANGTGKSRLGAWFENPGAFGSNPLGPGQSQVRQAHRISAQRSITLPSQAQRLDPTVAQQQFERGTAGPAAGDTRSRVQGDPVVGTLNDFDPLVNALFAERARVADDYRLRGIATRGQPGEVPTDTLTRVLEIWSKVFPERMLVAENFKLEARTLASNKEFPAPSMSDGERVGFYLVSHALLAPPNSRIVIDEPELHLHESIQSYLWDALEAARTDCTFIYITHDLAFAASRIGAPRVVLFDYAAPTESTNSGTWKWSCIPSSKFLPEDVALKILGSRRPVLFVEGEVGSLDQRVFEALFPDRLIVPSGSWHSVDRSVRTYRQISHLHHLKAAGFIDGDDRDDHEVRSLAERGVFVLPVGATENLLASDAVLSAVGFAQGFPESELLLRVEDAKKRVIDGLATERGRTIAQRAQYGVRRRIGAIVRSEDTKQALIDAVARQVACADPSAIFDAAEGIVDGALQAKTLNEKYRKALKVFRNKLVLHEIAVAYSMSTEDYISAALDLLRQPTGKLRAAVVSMLPPLEAEAV